MFNPTDFYDFAKMLFDCDRLENEACNRTIIGRCYYSSFLISKIFAIELGSIGLLEYDKPYFERKGEIHTAVRDSLFEHNLVLVTEQKSLFWSFRIFFPVNHCKEVTRQDIELIVETKAKICTTPFMSRSMTIRKASNGLW